MFVKLKGTDLDDEKLETSSGLYFDPGMPGGQHKLYDYMKEIRDLAYSIGYRHGREDEQKGA
jgi:hypothetical protein